jgi:hypothetical protein
MRFKKTFKSALPKSTSRARKIAAIKIPLKPEARK